MNHYKGRQTKKRPKISSLYDLNLMQALVLLRNLIDCEDSKNDSEYLVSEIVSILKRGKLRLPKRIMQSCMYSCNMQNEEEKFWHPEGKSLGGFFHEILKPDEFFNRYYNYIEKRPEKEPEDEQKKETI